MNDFSNNKNNNKDTQSVLLFVFVKGKNNNIDTNISDIYANILPVKYYLYIMYDKTSICDDIILVKQFIYTIHSKTNNEKHNEKFHLLLINKAALMNV